MNDKNQILEALGKLPELIESIKVLIEESEKKDAFLAKMAETKVEAQMSDEGKQEIVDIVEETVKATPCATPSVTEAGQLIADAVCDNVRNSVGEAIREKIANMSIKLEHHHTHATTYDLARYADKGARNLVLFLAGLCTILTLWSVGSAFWYFHSESYWAKEYRDILFSDVTTETEMKQLREGTYTVGCLPREFSEDPGAVKVKIKQNKAIIEQRRRQAKKNKGRYSSQPALVR